MTAQETLDRLLREGGFRAGGSDAPGLMDRARVKQEISADLRYGELLEAARDPGATVDYVYEIPQTAEELAGIGGTPSLYFKALEDSSDRAIPKLRQRIWNQGRVPALCVVTPISIRIYNCLARPQEGETERDHILGELDLVDGQIKKLATIERRTFDSGQFWRTGLGSEVKRTERVDVQLLQDLMATEGTLAEEGLDPDIIHALLGRAVFVSYLKDRLKDRKILPESFFATTYGCSSFEDILRDKPTTYAFFEWLKDTFNGDLFPVSPAEKKKVREPHLDLVRRFLLGYDMHQSGGLQQRFWPYSFDVIPIELISSIYERFAHSRDPRAAEAASVHYTRLNLVELTLSLAMQGLQHTATVLDPACGSGVFLLEAFRRLVWMRSKEYGRPLNRAELRHLLTSQIFGIDIDREAVQVAAFSLYLALLELDPEREHPEDLRFPPLRAYRDGGIQPPNLYVQDFCNTDHPFNRNHPFVDRAFDLIVGNVPWTALKERTALRDPDDPATGRRWAYEYCEREQIPYKKPDQAFMKRARDFADPATRIAFVVGSRLLYQESDRDKTWLDSFLASNTVHTVLNLTDLVHEDVLFGRGLSLTRHPSPSAENPGRKSSSTRLPASVIVFSAKPPSDESSVVYICPKWYPEVRGRDEIVVTGADVEVFPQSLAREAPFLWKTAFRATPRDFGLLRRLRDLMSLDDVLTRAGVSKRFHRGRGVTFGAGDQKDASSLKGAPYLPSRSQRRYSIDADSLDLFNRPTVAAKSNRRVLELPALVLFRSLRGDRSCTAVVEPTGTRHNLVVDQAYYGVSLARAQPSLSHRLNALLNSKMAFYMAFMLSPAVGWDRRLIEVGEWLKLRVPGSILDESDTGPWAQATGRETWLRVAWDSEPWVWTQDEIKTAETELDQAIFEAYGLSDQERVTVEDTLKYSIGAYLSRKRSRSSSFKSPTSGQLRAYASRLRSELNSILTYGGVQLSATVFDVKAGSLRACRFVQGPITQAGPEVSVQTLPEVEEILARISPNLRSQVADHLYVDRNLRVYSSESFWVIKPAEARLWSESAALNDADAIVSEHMEMGSHV